MNCTTHTNRPAVYECDRCGKPICQACYDDFDINDDDEGELHLCSECYKEYIRSDAAEAHALKGMVIREFVFIIIGLIVGLILGLDICFGFGIIVDEPTYIVVAPIYLPFIIGSLITIIKKIKYSYEDAREEGDDTNWITIIFIIIFQILIAPITTIMRFFQRIGDMRKLNRIERQDTEFLATVERYIEESLKPSYVEQSAAGGASGDVEISLDAILASSAGSEAALCDNGEILRTIRTR